VVRSDRKLEKMVRSDRKLEKMVRSDRKMAGSEAGAARLRAPWC
jgi:hypothetical protein